MILLLIKGWTRALTLLTIIAALNGSERAVALAAGSREIPRMTLQMGYLNTANTEMGQALQQFADAVRQLSGGQITIETHPGASLCLENTCIQDILQGSVDIGTSSDANFAVVTSVFQLIGMPYLWKNQASADRVMSRGLADKLFASLANTKNIKVLGYLGNYGFRDILNNVKAVRIPSDAQGLKIRSSNSKVEVALDKAWGMQPVVMGTTEVYSALAQNVIAAVNAQPIYIADLKWDEVLKHCTLTQAQVGFNFIFMRADKFASLPKPTQDIFLTAARRAMAWHTPRNAAADHDALVTIKNHGVRLYIPTPAEYTQWKQAGMTVWSQFKDDVPAAEIMQILKEQGCPSEGCTPSFPVTF